MVACCHFRQDSLISGSDIVAMGAKAVSFVNEACGRKDLMRDGDP